MFLNAFKMKVSILLGVMHMLFGVFMSLWNNIYFKNTLNILTEFIPQVIFLCGMFGYLCFLMVIKWWIYYATLEPAELARRSSRRLWCCPAPAPSCSSLLTSSTASCLAACCTTVWAGAVRGAVLSQARRE